MAEGKEPQGSWLHRDTQACVETNNKDDGEIKRALQRHRA